MSRNTISQRIELVRITYGDERKNSREVAKIYYERHRSNGSTISNASVWDLIQKFERLGTVQDAPKSGRPKSATNVESTAEIEAKVKETSMASAQQMANESGLSVGSVVAILRSLRYHLYKSRPTQEISRSFAQVRFLRMDNLEN